jgi:hypothetical protein
VSRWPIQRLPELWLIAPEQRRQRRLMVFRTYNGYLDETGDAHDSEIVAVAGYLSTYDDWVRFESEWNPLMRKFCVEDFHMSEFENYFKEFERNNYWTPEIRLSLIKEVCRVCQQHSALGIGCAVVRDQYERALPSFIQDEFRNPYFYCIYMCMQLLVTHQDDARIDLIKPVNFLFDRKGGRFRLGATMVNWQAFASEVFERIRPGLDDSGTLLGDMAFGKRQDYPQLRAADLLAYETGKLYRQWLNQPQRPLRKSMRQLLKKQNLLITFQTEVTLQNYVRVIQGIVAGRTAHEVIASLKTTDREADKINLWMRQALSEPAGD